MNRNLPAISRRSFLKLAAVGTGSLALLPWTRALAASPFPVGDRLGRVTASQVEVKAQPDIDSQTLGIQYEDEVLPWLRELVGKNIYRTNQRWVETPEGYIWSPYLQPVQNLQNTPVKSLPEVNGEKGIWVEVSVPYIDLTMDNPPSRSPGFKARQQAGRSPRLYYSQVMWVDKVKTDEAGRVWYRIIDRYGSYGDITWGEAYAFRPISADEIAPISPDVDEKRVLVNITSQTLSCFERKSEVFFAKISSGALYNSNGERVDAWATPTGKSPIWRKLVALHMSGGTTGGGWDLPGIAWTSLFSGSGVAIHSTFWHNNFGEPMSRGCVNARPEDAKWIFRWTRPSVTHNSGDITIGLPGGTQVEVIEG